MLTMRVLVLFALCGCISSAGVGQQSPQYSSCTSSAKSQTELNRCANEEAKRADTELNTVYRKILAALSGDQIALAKTKAAQRAWITYRDAYIEAMYPDQDKQAAYGTIYPMEVNLLRAKLTREHIRDLLDLEENRK